MYSHAIYINNVDICRETSQNWISKWNWTKYVLPVLLNYKYVLSFSLYRVWRIAYGGNYLTSFPSNYKGGDSLEPRTVSGLYEEEPGTVLFIAESTET